MPVREVQRFGYLPRQTDRAIDRKLPLTIEPMPETFALDERHREPQTVVGLSGVENADDVRVLKTGGEPDFLLETVGAER